MFEYKMLGEDDRSSVQPMSMIYSSKLKNDHLALVSPISDECEYDSSSGTYKKQYDPKTLNTFNHLAVPQDSKESKWFYFSDPDYKYVDSSCFEEISYDSSKIKEYLKYIPEGFTFTYGISGVRWDTARLYFVNGYDFSNMYGFMMRISVADSNDEMIDFCNFIVTRDNAYKLVKYMSSPILMGNDIYDKYIDVNLPCLYDLINSSEVTEITDLFTISDPNPIIKLAFSIILNEDKVANLVEYTIDEINAGVDYVKDPVDITFSRSATIKGAIPSDNVMSDNLGCYVAEVPDQPYIQFYGTWKGEPLTKDIVWRFNKGIPLYNVDLMRQNTGYEVDDDYEVEHSERKWIAMHEIDIAFCFGDSIVKKETYRMDQIFISDSDPDKFYYRPLIFDERKGLYIDNIHIVYTMRFINADDKVQFVKTSTMSLTGNMGRFFSKSTNLDFSSVAPYKVFTKVAEKSGVVQAAPTGIQKTKYINVFYNSTDVVLDDNGGNTYGIYQYTLQLSQSPKSYKFIFKKMNGDGKYEYMDLTNGYYKLMFIDASGETVTISPTFSSNMNLYLGELEFNINNETINKLKSVIETERKISIVAQNENNTISSMFDMLYTI